MGVCEFSGFITSPFPKRKKMGSAVGYRYVGFFLSNSIIGNFCWSSLEEEESIKDGIWTWGTTAN